MPKKYELNLTIEETGEDITQSGELSDADCELLEEFTQYADDLYNTDLIQVGGWGELNIEWSQNSMKVNTKLPQWDNVIVFIHKFRPLLLQNESTNFYKIYNILAKELDHPHFRNLLNQYREQYSGKTMQSGFRVTHDGVLINSEKILLDWLNAHEYHRNKDKQEYIDSLHRLIPLDASKVILLRLLAEKALGVFKLSAFIQVVLGKQKSLNMTLIQP